MADLITYVQTLLEKAVAAEKSDDAMKFAQAAANAANAMCGLKNAEKG